MIHLVGDSDRLARASIVERGEKWEKQLIEQAEAATYQKARGRTGIEGAVIFMEETQYMTREAFDVFDGTRWQRIELNVTSGDREANKQAALRFVGVDEVRVAPPALSVAPEAYAGAYAQEDPEGSVGPLEVRIEQDRLVLYQPGMQLGTLVAVGESRFHLRASQLDVEFEMEDGTAQRLLLHRASGGTRTFRRV